MSASREFIASFITRTVENAVKTKTETTKTLGIKGLKNLKVELASLIEQVPDLVDKNLNVDSLWLHRSTDPPEEEHRTRFYNSYSKRLNDPLDRAIRNTLGSVGQLLSKFQLAEIGQRGQFSDASYGGPMRYQIYYGPSPQMVEIFMKYCVTFEEYHSISSDLQGAITKKAQAEAQDLWNRA